jgi:Family of unknown function (DUF6788)
MADPSTDYATLQTQRQALLQQLAPLEQLRRGSLIAQYFVARRQDGSRVKRGPYPLLTRKHGQKTVSVRLTDPALLPLYRQQLAALRQFDAVVGQLVAVGEQLSELAVSEVVQKKTGGGTGTSRRGAAPGRDPGRRVGA